MVSTLEKGERVLHYHATSAVSANPLIFLHPDILTVITTTTYNKKAK